MRGVVNVLLGMTWGLLMLFLAAGTFFFASHAHAAQELQTEQDTAKAFARHRPMIIMNFAQWCGPCHETKPEFLKLEQTMGDKVDFYLMDVDKIQLGGPNPKDREQGAVVINAIPTFVCGKTEREVRSGKHVRVGGGSAMDIAMFLGECLGDQK